MSNPVNNGLTVTALDESAVTYLYQLLDGLKKSDFFWRHPYGEEPPPEYWAEIDREYEEETGKPAPPREEKENPRVEGNTLHAYFWTRWDPVTDLVRRRLSEPFFRVEYQYQDELNGTTGHMTWDGTSWTERHTGPQV